MAECIDPERVELLYKTGCDAVVCLTALATNLVVHELLDPFDRHEISAARWGSAEELAGPIRARLLDTGRALWRYRVALHDAALAQMQPGC